MALAGPLTSLVIGGVAVAAGFGANVLGWPALVAAVFFYVGLANLALGVFNLIPGFPMDGGRVLRSIIWRVTGNLRKATIWAANVGQFVAYLMIVVGVWLFFWGGQLWNGIWIGLIGLFILQAARAEITRVELEAAIEGATVQQFMTPQPPLVTPDLSLRQFVDDYLLRAGQRTVAVVERGSMRLIGMVTLQDVRQVPQELWSSAVIGQIMTPLARLKTLRPEQPVSDALTLLAEARVGHLPVVSADGEVLGMLSLASLLEYLQMERDLGVRASKVAEREPERRPLSKVG
jgi:CBS domain-containing protein